MYNVVFWNVQSSLSVGDVDLCRGPGMCPEQRATEAYVSKIKRLYENVKGLFFVKYKNSVHCFSYKASAYWSILHFTNGTSALQLISQYGSMACKTHAWSWGGRVSNPTCTEAVRLLEKQLDLMKSEKQADHCDQWIHDRFHFSTHCIRFSNILSTTLNWNGTRRPELDAGAPGRRNTGHIVCSALDFRKTYEGQPAIITVTWSRKSGTMIQS